MRNRIHLPALIFFVGAILLLAGCEDDDAPAGPMLYGTAAIGAPLAGSTVTLRCQNERILTTATLSTGAWSIPLPEADLPCLIKATTADGLNDFFAVALPMSMPGAQIVNITPLTSLVVAHAIDESPTQAWFAGLDDAGRAALANNIPASVAAVVLALRAADYDMPLTFNPLQSTLVADAGDVHDGWLEKFSAGIAGSGQTFGALLTQYTVTGALPQSSPTADSTSSGTLRVQVTGESQPRTFVTDPNGLFIATWSGDQASYIGFNSSEVKLVSGDFIVVQDNLQVEVTASGHVRNVYYLRQETGHAPIVANCADTGCIGVAFEHTEQNVAKLVLTDARLGEYTFSGTLIGHIEGAIWRPQDLPRTTVGTVRVNGELRELLWATSSVSDAFGSHFVEVEIQFPNEGPLVLSKRRYLGYSGEEWLTSHSGYHGYLDPENYGSVLGSSLVCETPSTCGLTIMESESSVVVELDNAVFRNQSGVDSIYNGSVTVLRNRGILTIGGAPDLVPESREILAYNSHGMHLYVESDDGRHVAVRSWDGTVESVEIRAFDNPARFLCGKHYIAGATFVVPPCDGITLSANGLDVTFDQVMLVDALGETHATVPVNGSLHAQGL